MAMTDYFQNSYFPDPNWNIIGYADFFKPALNKLTQYLYPMEKLTRMHKKFHIQSVTHTWMDQVSGSCHRLKHGHHLIKDGFTVLTTPNLKFGDFLHHLGCDIFTKEGIPNPLLPTKTLLAFFHDLGFKMPTINELLSVNIPKIFGGSLALLCTGSDVWACFSDTIPHTWTAALWHGGLGAFDIFCGWFPRNPLLFLAGGAEIGVGVTTAARTLIDVFTPAAQAAADSFVLFPVWMETAALSALFGACLGYWNGQSYERIVKNAGIAMTTSTIASAVSYSLTGNFIAPFIGGAAGFLTGLLLRKIFLNNQQNEAAEAIKKPIINYFNSSSLFNGVDYFNQSNYFNQANYFANNSFVMPIMQIQKEPIGHIYNDTLELNPKSLSF